MQRANSDHGSQPSLFRLVETGWAAELIDGVREGPAELRIVCPFIKERALDRLLELGPKNIRVITRFNLADFADGVSDIAALRKLLRAGAAVRGIRNLHAKLYLFGDRRAIVTSANLTEAGLCHNPEFGVVTNDATAVRECRAYFDNLWSRGGGNLCREKLDAWDGKVKRHLVSGQTETTGVLNDLGVDAGLDEVPPGRIATIFENAPQAFVKFLGESTNRAALVVIYNRGDQSIMLSLGRRLSSEEAPQECGGWCSDVHLAACRGIRFAYLRLGRRNEARAGSG